MYNTFTDDHFYFFLCGLIYRIVTGAVTGWIDLSGVAQISVIVVFEVLYLLLHLIRWPYASRSVNILHIIFASLRVISVILSLLYIESLAIADTTKQAIGWTQIILHFIVFLIMFIVPVRNLVVLITGIGDDELYESGVPPARMVWWRRQR
ncbi:TRP-like family, partial [Dichotomocladium elegans]